MACGCAERREAIRRGIAAVIDREPDAGKTLKAQAAFVARSSLAAIVRVTKAREAKRGNER